MLHKSKIRFIAPSPASSLFTQAICSVTPEELDGCVFPDKDGTPKFKVTERGVYIHLQDKKKQKELKDISAFWARCLIVWSKSRAKLDREKREKYVADIKERLEDIAATKLNMRRYKNKEYAQNQVDKCFKGPKSYLRKIFGNPTIEERDGQLQLVYSIDKALLAEMEKQDGLYPIVTNVYDYEKYSTRELFLRTRKKYSVEQPMRYLKSKIKVRPIFLHNEERIKGLTLVTFMALMAYCILELPNVVYVLDLFHLQKYITAALKDDKKTKSALLKALFNQDRDKANEILNQKLKELSVQNPENPIAKCQQYINNNWDGIRAYSIYKEQIIGCSAESHVSHILSERLSRGPISWSKQSADKIAQLRAIKANGISIKKAILKQRYEALKPIKLPKQTLYKERQKIKKLKQAASERIINLPVLSYKKTFTSMAIKSLLSHRVI